MKFVSLILLVSFAGCGGSQSVVEDLSEAIALGQTDKVTSLIKKHPEILNSKEATQYYILAEAIEDLPQVIETMLDAGANLDGVKSRNGGTLLATAARYARTEVAQLLLDRGVDPNELGDDRRSPLATLYRQMQHSDQQEHEALLELEKTLLAGGAILPSASSLKTCPNGTALVDIDVIESFVELDEEQLKWVTVHGF